MLTNPVSYEPQFTIRPRLLALVEDVRSCGSVFNWQRWSCPGSCLQKTPAHAVHASTAIEGNPLTLEEVRALGEGRR